MSAPSMPAYSADNLAQADAATDQFSPHKPAAATVAPCPLAKLGERLEVLVIGMDNKPVPDIAVELRRGRDEMLRSKTGSDGAVRFHGLTGGPFQLSLYELDRDAWELVRTEPLRRVLEQVVDWDPAPPPAAAGDFLYKVAQGDCVAKLADRFGLSPDALWNYGKNEELRSRRESLYVLQPGDQCWIPSKRAQGESSSAGNRYVVRRKGVPEVLRVRFVNLDQKPRSGTAYLLRLTTTSSDPYEDRKGVTDGDGYLTESVPPSATCAEVIIGPPVDRETYQFLVGHLDPVTSVRGVQARLNNLGYFCGQEDGFVGPRTRIALEAFQIDYGLAIDEDVGRDGPFDADTRAALERIHGS